jgi:hypothetical protein
MNSRSRTGFGNLILPDEETVPALSATRGLDTRMAGADIPTPTLQGIRIGTAWFLGEVALLAARRGTFVIAEAGRSATTSATCCRNRRRCGDGSFTRVVMLTGICSPSARDTNRKSGRRMACSAAGTRETPAPEATRGNNECHSAGRMRLDSNLASLQQDARRPFCRMDSERSVTIQVSCAS